jgi:transcriptional regulatory protein LevR
MRQALTFLATMGTDHHSMKTLAVISILALLTISGAAYTDQLLTSDQQAAQRAN